MNRVNRKTNLFIISGPSGAGEDSVIEGLRRRGLPIDRVITTITREPRKGEQKGKSYYFVSIDQFRKMIKANQFIEWALVYGDFRGCTYEELERVKKSGKIGLWKIDYQGVQTIKQNMPEVISIFIAPQTLEVLNKRLRKRGQDKLEEIKKRASYTKKWMKYTNIYDYQVVNKEGKLDQTIDCVLKIIKRHLFKR